MVRDRKLNSRRSGLGSAQCAGFRVLARPLAVSVAPGMVVPSLVRRGLGEKIEPIPLTKWLDWPWGRKVELAKRQCLAGAPKGASYRGSERPFSLDFTRVFAETNPHGNRRGACAFRFFGSPDPRWEVRVGMHRGWTASPWNSYTQP